MTPAKKILVGLSGGVDSSVAALLLQQAGWEVWTVFMKNWHETSLSGPCSSAEDAERARQVAHKLGVEFRVVDFSAEYQERVFAPFLQAQKRGETPNPDVWCNPLIKFPLLRAYGKSLEIEHLATGHYADVVWEDGVSPLRRPQDRAKDQTYFLHQLSAEHLKNTHFPLAELKKSAVRELAEAHQLPTAKTKDSTGLCFIGERPHRPFLQDYLPTTPGEIVTENGQVIGAHQGLAFYTIAQRRDLCIGGVKGAAEAPWLVLRKEPQTNQLIVTQNREHPSFFPRKIAVKDLHWIAGDPPDLKSLEVQVRYRQAPVQARLTLLKPEGTAEIEFLERPPRAPASGQLAVVYSGEICWGGGVIVEG